MDVVLAADSPSFLLLREKDFILDLVVMFTLAFLPVFVADSEDAGGSGPLGALRW